MAVTLSRAEIESLLGGLNLGSTNKPDARKDTLRQFGESLAEAIETGDPAHAGEVIIKHISDGFELQIEALEKDGSD